MPDELLCELYVYLPAFLANASPVLARHVPFLRALAVPVQSSVFGRNKTVRGLLSGIATGIATCVVQMLVARVFPLACDPLDRSSLGVAVTAGFLLGFGAIAGDMLESAAKRRLGLLPGQALPVWDGMDYLLGALVFLAPLHLPGLRAAAFLLLLAPAASLLANSAAYFLGWKDRWY